ncbi:MAG: DHH family phosphoesterase [Candidatus Paceibacterota bacterium]|jgi:phosphoesterase RecJ-like protein
MSISPEIKEKTPLILEAIKQSRSVLLHCHPSPDPDSVGSALAMKFALEQLGKKATVIRGDSEIPQAFMHFPGARDIVQKSYWEIDPADYDLFIIVDSSITGVSRTKAIQLPAEMKVINLDHHRTNTGCGSINIIDSAFPATAELLFHLFKEVKIDLTPDIAANLFIGLYTDTGGFKYQGTTEETFKSAGELIRIFPGFSQLVADMENSNTIGDLAFQGLALSAIEAACDNKVLLSVVPYAAIKEKNIPDGSISAGSISTILRTVGSFDITVALIECRPNLVRLSFRSGNSGKYDVSQIAAALGGGGHRAAAGATLEMSLVEAKQTIVQKVKEMYNL